MAISYEDAMNTLKSMFDTVDENLIKDLLAANGMQMEPTIEQLLALQDDSANAEQPPLPSFTSPPAPAPTTLPPPPAGAPPGVQQHNSRWRHPLPHDFLKVPGFQPGAGASQGRSQEEFAAQMLQDDLFIEQLRQDPEFAQYLQVEQGVFNMRPEERAQYGSERPRRRQRRAGSETPEDSLEEGQEGREATPGVPMKVKLGEMGANMRRKFNSFAARFKRKQNKAGNGARQQQYSSLLHDEDEEDDDGTLTGSGAATQHPAARTEGGEPEPSQTDFEMTSLSNTPRNGARQRRRTGKEFVIDDEDDDGQDEVRRASGLPGAM